MEMKEVESSNVQAVGFDPDTDGDTGTLHVRFGNGVTYEYAEVPVFLAEEMFESDSIGRFVNLNLRSKYEGKKIDTES